MCREILRRKSQTVQIYPIVVFALKNSSYPLIHPLVPFRECFQVAYQLRFILNYSLYLLYQTFNIQSVFLHLLFLGSAFISSVPILCSVLKCSVPFYVIQVFKCWVFRLLGFTAVCYAFLGQAFLCWIFYIWFFYLLTFYVKSFHIPCSVFLHTVTESIMLYIHLFLLIR